MDMAIWLLQAVLPGLVVGIVMAAWNRQQKKRVESSEQKEQDHIENEMMRIDLEVATAQLAHAVAMAYKRGSPNGEMEAALCQYEKAMEKFRKFERKQMARSGLD